MMRNEINWGTTYDIVPMMKKKSNKEETYLEPRMVSKWREKKLIFNRGCSPIDEKRNQLTLKFRLEPTMVSQWWEKK